MAIRPDKATLIFCRNQGTGSALIYQSRPRQHSGPLAPIGDSESGHGHANHCHHAARVDRRPDALTQPEAAGLLKELSNMKRSVA